MDINFNKLTIVVASIFFIAANDNDWMEKETIIISAIVFYGAVIALEVISLANRLDKLDRK